MVQGDRKSRWQECPSEQVTDRVIHPSNPSFLYTKDGGSTFPQASGSSSETSQVSEKSKAARVYDMLRRVSLSTRSPDDSRKKVNLVSELEMTFKTGQEEMRQAQSILIKDALTSNDPFYWNLRNVIGLATRQTPIESWNKMKEAENVLQWYQQYMTRHSIDKNILDCAQQYVEEKRALLPTFGSVISDQKAATERAREKENTSKSIKELNTEDAENLERHISILRNRIKLLEDHITRVERLSQYNDAVLKIQPEISNHKYQEKKPQIEEDINGIKRKIWRLDESIRKRDKEERNLKRRKGILRVLDRMHQELNGHIGDTKLIHIYESLQTVSGLKRKLKNVEKEIIYINYRLEAIKQERSEKQGASQALLYAIGMRNQEGEVFYETYLTNQKRKLQDMQAVLAKANNGELANDVEVRKFKLDKVQARKTDSPFDRKKDIQMINEMLERYPVPRLFDGLGAHPWISEPMMYQGLLVTAALQNHGIRENIGATIIDREGGYASLSAIYLLNTIIHTIKGLNGYRLHNRYEQGLQKIKRSLTEEQFHKMKQLPEDQQWIIRRDGDQQHSKKTPFKIDYNKAWNRYKALSKITENKVSVPIDNLGKSDLESWQQLKEILFLHIMKEYRGKKALKYAIQNAVTSVAFSGGGFTYAFVGLGIGVVPYAGTVLAASMIKDWRHFKHFMRNRYARAVAKRETEISEEITRLIFSSEEMSNRVREEKARIISLQPTKHTGKPGDHAAKKKENSDIPRTQETNSVYAASIYGALRKTEEAMQEKRTFFSAEEKKQFVDDTYDIYLQEEQHRRAREEVREERSLRTFFNPDRDKEVQEKLNFCAATTFEIVRNLLTSSEEAYRQDDLPTQVSPNQQTIDIHVLHAVSEKNALDKLSAKGFTYTDPFQREHGREEIEDAFIRYHAAIALLTDCGAIDAEKEMREKIRMTATSKSENKRSKQSGNDNPKIPILDMFDGLKDRAKDSLSKY